MEPLTDEQHQQEGVVIDESPLRLDIEDNLLREIIEKRIKDSNDHYKTVLKLDTRKKENERFWLGDHWPEREGEQEPYKDNIIWQNSEKRIELASGRMPDIVVTPASDNMTKRERAKLIEKVLNIKLTSSEIKRLIKDGLRQHGIYFLAAIKARWDPNKGENGDFLFELVRPNRFGLDHTSTISHDGFTADNIKMIWEWIDEPLATVLSKFPAKAAELKSKFKTALDPKMLVTEIRYLEVHFTWYTNDGQPIECVVHKYKDLILDKIKTPYFDYEGYTKRVYEDEENPEIPDREVKSKVGKYYRNHFERPRKPYILVSHQNLGRSPYDDTTAIEQSIPLQKNVNNRGRQITDIANKMKPRYAFNAAMEKKDAEAISNDNEDNIWINSSQPISELVASFQSLAPSPVLYNDLVSNRGQIDAKFSTHGTTRGEIEATNESGISKQITREGDLVTSDDIVDIVVERVIFEMASWALQLVKLNYDKPHFIRNIGPDGEMVEAELTRDLIDDGMAINVKASSVDKITQRNDAFTLAKVKAIDPLTLAEDMDAPNPKERTRRLMYFLMGEQDQYARYMQETGLLKEDEAGAQAANPGQQAVGGTPGPVGMGPQPAQLDAQQAVLDLQALQSGQPVQPQGIPSTEYVQVFIQFVQSPQFDTLDPAAQNNIRSHIGQLRAMVEQQAAAQPAPQEVSNATI